MTIRTSTLSAGIVVAILAPAAAFLLHDLVFQLPDNQHEATLGFFLTVFGLLFVWGVGGYLAGRRTRTMTAAAAAGLTTAATSVIVLWLTFLTSNLAYPDRMSYEPDRIRAFRASGYPTVREYVVHNMTPGPFPLLLGVAVVIGIAGSCLGGRLHDRGA